MKVPKDPNLYLTVFTGICVSIVMVFWLLTPVYTPHLEHEDEHSASVKPEQALAQVDATLTAAEKTLAEMDAKEGGKTAGSGDSKKEAKKAIPATKEPAAPTVVMPASAPDAHVGHDMASQDHAPEESSHSHDGGGDHGH